MFSNFGNNVHFLKEKKNKICLLQEKFKNKIHEALEELRKQKPNFEIILEIMYKEGNVKTLEDQIST